MASSLTAITVNRTLADCGAVLLAGPTKIAAESMGDHDEVYILEETGTEGNYQKVRDGNWNFVRLNKRNPSIILEGYGNYKFQLGQSTSTTLVVGYAAA